MKSEMSQLRIVGQDCLLRFQLIRNPPAWRDEIRNYKAFSLVELLVVISIITVIAALLLPVAGAVKKQSMINTAKGEMAQLETAIDRYKSTYGFYPPDNPCDKYVNQLYFELLGTTNTVVPPTSPVYQSLDDPTILVAQSDLVNIFGGSCVNGFMNCNKPGADESIPQVRNFLPDLKPRQITVYTNNFPQNKIPIKLLITSVGGPDRSYQPLGAVDLNPWRYNSSNPTNNPGSYDLWVQLSISGATNLICNWNKQVQINSPLP